MYTQSAVRIRIHMRLCPYRLFPCAIKMMSVFHYSHREIKIQKKKKKKKKHTHSVSSNGWHFHHKNARKKKKEEET